MIRSGERIKRIAMLKKPLSRKEKEARYIDKSIELQMIWKNPIGPNDAGMFQQTVEKLTDDELERDTAETVGQIQFEKGIAAIRTTVKFVVGIFVVLGIAGLLVFGIKQLLATLR